MAVYQGGPPDEAPAEAAERAVPLWAVAMFLGGGAALGAALGAGLGLIPTSRNIEAGLFVLLGVAYLAMSVYFVLMTRITRRAAVMAERCTDVALELAVRELQAHGPS